MALLQAPSIAANPHLCTSASSRPLHTPFLLPTCVRSSLSFSSNASILTGFDRCRRSEDRHNRRHVGGARALFGLGVPELAVIAGVTALIFGPSKLPEIGKSLGKTVKSFQQAAKEFESEVKQGGDSVPADPAKPEAIPSGPGQDKENVDV